jgi:hypothetical protein
MKMNFNSFAGIVAEIPANTGQTEAVFLNVYGARESIPKNEFRQST